MNSVRDLSKDKDIIRIIGGMPDRVLDKDAESEGADIAMTCIGWDKVQVPRSQFVCTAGQYYLSLAV